MLKTGINLRIDSSINEICEISNKSSSQTRAVLYLVVIAAMIQFIVLLNTFEYSWQKLKHDKKIAELNNSIDSLQESLNTNPENRKTIELLRYQNQSKLQLERYDIENFELLRIPILNISIHVNDTGLISGVLLCILFSILVFTLEREETNLCLALNAITNRYTNDSEHDLFKDAIEKFGQENKDEVLAEINKTRRSFHYNLLTMNEIYTKPEISIQLYSKKKTNDFKTKLLNEKYSFAIAILTITFIHDLITMGIGFSEYSVERTIAHYIFMFSSISLLLYLTIKCNKITKNILKRYNNFKKNNYKFEQPPAIPAVSSNCRSTIKKK